MNRFLSAALVLALLAANPAAYADGRHAHNDHARVLGHDHGLAHRPAPRHPDYPYPQHENNDNHTAWPAYVVGGLVLGALVTNAFSAARPTTYGNVGSATSPSTDPVHRRLLRDINGNCYERETDGAGNELSTELPPSACAW